MREASRALALRPGGARLHLPADGPDEARELSRDRHHQLIAVHPACGEFAKASAQAQLRLPGDMGSPLCRRAMIGVTRAGC
jgi:hypothetical protein